MDEHLEAIKESLAHRYQQLEETRRLGLPLAATRRFFEIEGLDLAALLALELFTTVIPIILLGFGWASGFSTRLSFGDVLIHSLGLEGAKAEQVRSAFGTGASLRSTWTVFGLASFLVWGIPMAVQVAKTFAQAWRRERFPLIQEIWRGAVWFALFLGTQAATVALSRTHPHTIVDRLQNLAGLVPSFFLWAATPWVLVRNGSNGWRHLAWCGLAGVVLDALLIRWMTRLLLPALLGGWTGFGPIGVAMTLMTWCTVAAAMCVATGCIGAVLWERNAPADVVVSSQRG